MQSQTPAVAVVGNINLDLKTGPIPADARLFRDGETSVGEIYEAIGGGGANTAIAGAQMGGRVCFCGAIGNDALGEKLVRFLTRCGVESELAIKPVPTGRSIALSFEQHQRHFVSSLPSALLLEAEDVDVQVLASAGCRHLYRADIWFAPRMLEEGNLHLLREARRYGMSTSIDINWDPHWHGGRQGPVEKRIDDVTRLLHEVTFLHGNERELCFFAGIEAIEDAANWYLGEGVQTVIVHQGANGSSAMSADGAITSVPAARVERTVTEAGTGDVFTAAFLMRDGMELSRRLRESNAAAAAHLAGNASWLPRLDE